MPIRFVPILFMKKSNDPLMLANEPVGKLLTKLSVPAIMGMISMALYNVVDTIFIGQGAGALAIGGLAIVFPIQMIINSVAQAVGLGGASIVSRSLGANDMAKANLTFGNIMTLIILLSIFILPFAYYYQREILIIFGAEGQILVYAQEYYSIVIWSGPFLSFAMTTNSIIRAEGNARVAMVTMLISSVLNLILDPIFIFALDMGIKGAAYATLISIVLTNFYLWLYFKSGKSALNLKLQNLKPDAKIIWETISIGASSFTRQAAGSFVAIVMNHSLMHYGSEMAVAAYGVINRVLMFIFMPLFGVVQGFMPIVGYNFGAKNFGRVRSAIKVSFMATTIMAMAGMLLVLLFPAPIVRIFSNDTELLAISKNALQIIVLAFPLIGIQVIGAGLFQALGKALPSLFLSLSRQVLFLLPLIAFLPTLLGINGIWYSFPLADVLAFSITAFMVYRLIKTIPTENAEKTA